MTQIAESRLAEIEKSIAALLEAPLYTLAPEQCRDSLLALFKLELEYACERNPRFANYVQHWPVRLAEAETIADLPYLPVSVFKADPPLSLVPPPEIRRTLFSSSTSGQIPSRIVLDSATAKRMTKGVIAIVRDFIGPARRPYLVIDSQENLGNQAVLGARGAAIQGLRSFATEIVACLKNHASSDGAAQDASLDIEKLQACAEKWRDTDVLVYGFTYVLWTQLVKPLQQRGISLRMPNIHVLHSGGWKRLEQQAVTKDVFARELGTVLGCSPDRIIDFYGMVENVGVIYPDCERGCKHVPAFAEVIVRDPLTLAPVGGGRQGLVQVCSVLPTSFPGFLLLTDDLGEMVGHDACGCGRRGTHFRFLRRVPKVEMRGCGNLETSRKRQGSGA